jgi:hypothetical protein
MDRWVDGQGWVVRVDGWMDAWMGRWGDDG